MEIELVGDMPNHISAHEPMSEDAMGVMQQSIVLVEVQTSLNLFTFKKSDLWDHIKNEEAQNKPGKIMMNMTMNACVHFFTLILSCEFYP